jgi:predicted PurR-regulated permease PerM
MAKAMQASRSSRSLVVLTAAVVGMSTLLVLYWGRPVLIPFALAIYLTFLLNPVVKALQHWGLRRIPSVIVVNLLAALVVVAVGWVVVSQCTSFINKLPDYTGALQHKVQSFKAMTESPGMARLNKMVQELGDAWKPAAPKESSSAQPDLTTGTPADPTQKPVPVTIGSTGPAWINWLPGIISPTMEVAAQASMAIVLAIFMLLGRERLRNRFIRLIGHGHMTLTTKAVDDASQRISRFLIMQLLINAGFGVVIAIGLALIGVEHAPLWGFLSGLMRYVPYIGTPIAFLFPLAVSVGLSDSWLTPVLVIVLYGALEIIAASVLEPWLFGQSVGVSAVALLATAAFWSFL